MAYQAGGTDYGGMLRLRAQADEGLTGALKAKGEAEKKKRIADSKKRSGGQKLLSAAARGAAAYFTGGASEAMGFGGAIDKAMLGADAETNEYGELVGMASQVGGAMSAKKTADMAQKLQAQSAKDDAMQARFDKLDPTGRAGMEFALKREKKDTANMAALQKAKKGSFGGLFQGDIEGVDLEPTTVGDYQSVLAKQEADKTVPTFDREKGEVARGRIGSSEMKQGGDPTTSFQPVTQDDYEVPIPAVPTTKLSSDEQPGIMNTKKNPTTTLGDTVTKSLTAGGSQADRIKKQLEAQKKQEAELAQVSNTENVATNNSTFSDWYSNPGSSEVTGTLTNRGVPRYPVG